MFPNHLQPVEINHKRFIDEELLAVILNNKTSNFKKGN